MGDTHQTAATPAKPKRATKIKRVIHFAEGEPGPRLKNGAVPVSFDLIWEPTGETVSTALVDVPEASRVNALVFGLITNFTNAAGGKDATMADLLDRRELVMAGEWAEAVGEGGPSPTLLAEAVFRAQSAKGVTTMSDGSPLTIEAVTAKVKSWEAETRKAVKADAQVAAAYAEIELERAKERAKKLKAEAKAAAPEADGVAGLL